MYRVIYYEQVHPLIHTQPISFGSWLNWPKSKIVTKDAGNGSICNYAQSIAARINKIDGLWSAITRSQDGLTKNKAPNRCHFLTSY